MNRKHLVALALLIWATAPVCAQTIKEGIEAWQRGNYAAAVGIWKPLAEQGDADAQFNIGQAYRLGRGVQTNLAAAKDWFEKAATQGHVDAQTTLGLLLFENSDQAEGLRWLQKAAEQGDPRALLVFGTALVNGDSVTQDPVLGYAYIQRAAAQGLAPAKDTLEQLDHLLPAADRKKGLLIARKLAKAGPKSRRALAKGASRTAQAASSKPIELTGSKSARAKAAASSQTNTGASKALETPGTTPVATASSRTAQAVSPKAVETARAEPAPRPGSKSQVTGKKTEAPAAAKAVETAAAKARAGRETASSAAGSKATKPAAAAKPASGGAWRVQVGAFSQKGNAEALYQKLSGKPALAGLSPFYIPVGAITRLQIGPFETKSSAQGACRALDVACFPVAIK